MQSIIQKLMTFAAAAVVSISAPTADASTIRHLDLDLKLQKTGYEYLTILDSSGNILQKHSFLDSLDNVWGIRPVADLGYAVSQKYSLVATLGTNQFSNCYLGSRSCTNAFGRIDEHSFNIGDGAGLTGFGDFSFSGGTNVDDKAVLNKFEGADYFQQFDDGRFAFWRSDVHVFSVVQNNLTTMPLPAGLPLLLAGVGGLGLMARLKRKVT